ncbi:MAG: site-specific integrase, partial [Candidatus Latescibacterota bacterium]
MPDPFHLSEYITCLDVEQGLSRNTLGAYLHDVERYIAWLGERGVRSPREVE